MPGPVLGILFLFSHLIIAARYYYCIMYYYVCIMYYVLLLSSFDRWEQFPKVIWLVNDRKGIQAQAVLAPVPVPLTSTHSVAQGLYSDLLVISGRAGAAGSQLFLDPGHELCHYCPGSSWEHFLLILLFIKWEAWTLNCFWPVLYKSVAEPLPVDSGSLNCLFIFQVLATGGCLMSW